MGIYRFAFDYAMRIVAKNEVTLKGHFSILLFYQFLFLFFRRILMKVDRMHVRGAGREPTLFSKLILDG